VRELILGIDALDPHFIEDFLPHLPTFQMLREQARWHIVNCDAAAPNSPAGWSTIYCGLPASEHNVKDWDYIASITTQWKGTTNHLPTTFWKDLNKAGFSVGLMCPPLLWPAPSIDGWAVAGFPTPYQFPEQMNDYNAPDEQYSSQALKDLEPIGHVVDTVQYKNRNKDEYYKTEIKNIESLPLLRLEYALRAIRNLSVDVGFIFFSYLDRLCHSLNHRCWVEKKITPEEAKDHILWAYKKVDRIIALALSATTPDRVVICGDHGFNFSTRTRAIHCGQWYEDDPRLIGHTASTVAFILSGNKKGAGEEIPLTQVYYEIVNIADNEVIKDKLKQLGYI